MSTLGLELCDHGSFAAFADGEGDGIIPLEDEGPASSPGFVFFDGSGYLAGRGAEQKARTFPRQVSDRAWDQLSLRVSDVTAKRKAPLYSELAFHHFKHLWERASQGGRVDKVVVAVPGEILRGEHGDEEKIGLLLGMVADLKIPLAGIVDLACAAALTVVDELAARPGPAFLLDVFQHAATVTALDVEEAAGGGRTGVGHRSLTRSPHLGFARIYAELLPLLGNRFLSETAFDITHDATLEQAFYDQVTGLLREFRGGAHEAVIELVTGRRPRHMAVARDDIALHLEKTNASLVQLVEKAAGAAGAPGAGTVLLSARARKLPGLAAQLAAGGRYSVVPLEPGAAALGSARFARTAPVVSSLEATPLITLLEVDLDPAAIPAPPTAGEPAAAPPATGEDVAPATPDEAVRAMAPRPPESVVSEVVAGAPPAPTHLLGGGVATPLTSDGSPCRLETPARPGAAPRVLCAIPPGRDALINGRPVAPGTGEEEVGTGDVITLQDPDGGPEEVYTVIHVTA